MITVVTGPPAAGKTSYVREHAKPGDAVVDFDALAQALGSPVSHDHSTRIRALTAAAWGAAIRNLVRDGGIDAWIIDARPLPDRLRSYERAGARIVRLGATRAELHRRALEAGRPDSDRARIDEWFDNAPPPVVNPGGWGSGSTAAWRRIRWYVLQRDRWICGLCHTPIPRQARHPHPDSATVHHTRGKAYGDDPAYLVAAHRRCNLKAGEPGKVKARGDPKPKQVTRW